MKKIHPTSIPKENPSLLDRFAVAWLSGLTATITAGLFILTGVTANMPGEMIAAIVMGFVLLMSVLGFLLMDNLLATLLGWLWALIFYPNRY